MNSTSLYEYGVMLHDRLRAIDVLSVSTKYTRLPDAISTFSDKHEVFIVQHDFTVQLRRDLEDGLRPLLVCPANEKQACGLWDAEGDGFEEQVSYKSTLPMALKDVDYPLRQDDAIYCPTVCFFRGARYEILKKCITASVIAIPTVKRPDFTIENDCQKVRSKLEMAFRVATMHNHTSLIMNAFGCDDDNDPVEVAKILKRLVDQYRIARVTIVFDAAVNDPNYLTFRKTVKNCF